MEPKTFAIIVNYNNYKDLKETIDSFKVQECSDLNIIVVDNGSEAEYIKKIEHIDGIFLIRNEDNLGWAAANNIGIKYAIENGANFVILANNDLYFDDRTLVDKLISEFPTLKEKLNCGILAPAIYNYINRDKIQSNGGVVFRKYERLGFVFNKYRIERIKDSTTISNVNICDFVYGCFMIVDVKLFENVGLFDEKMFMYHEDIDFGYRSWLNSYSICSIRNRKVFHKESLTSKKYSPFYWYYFSRNFLYLLKKHRKGLFFYMALLYDYIKIIFRIGFKRYENIISRRKAINAILQGIYKGFIRDMNNSFKG